MAQSEVGNKSVAKTIENNDEDEEYGPQLIGKLEVIIILDGRMTVKMLYNEQYFLLIYILRTNIHLYFINILFIPYR